uniref:Protein TsetseEP domain-containing protein n=1 Tax=Anopheles atroparvus TaxID=41427 RepID=A0A182JC90_ANOAO
MKSYYSWFAVVAVLAISLPDVSAQYDNTVVSRRQSINSTLQSFTNNINSKVTDYTNKFTSLRNDMSSQLNSAKQTLTNFLTDSTIGTNALLASDALVAATTALTDGVSASISITASGFGGVGSCLNSKTQASVNLAIGSLTSANTNFTITISSSTSSFTSTCRGRYTNTANDLVNQFADRLQDCLNQENTQLSRVSSILNNFMSLMRQNYQGLTNNVRYCSGLGSTSSREEVKAEIDGCLKSLANTAYPIYKSNLEQQFVLVRSMLQLEVVASNNRVKGCVNQVTGTYQAMADAIPIALSTCLSTGQ